MSSPSAHRSVATGLALTLAGSLLGATPATPAALAAESAARAGWGPVTDLAASRSQSRPDVVVGPRGATTVLWRTQNAVVAVRRDPDGRWGAPRRLGNGTAPRLGVDGRGVVTAMWTRHLPDMGPQVMVARRPPGEPWSRPRALSAPVATPGTWGKGAFQTGLAVGHDGAVLATWLWGADDSGSSRVQARYRPAGRGWNDVATLSPVEARTPVGAVGDDGRAVVVYTVDARAFAVRRAAGGWVPRREIGRHVQPPQVAMSDAGEVTVAWSALLLSEGRFRPQAVVGRAGGGWSAPRTLDLSDHARSEPAVTTGPLGRTTVLWSRSDGSVVVAGRVPGRPWTGPTRLAGPGAPVVGGPPYLGLAVGRSGAVVATWTRGSAGSHAVEAAFRGSRGGWQPAQQLSPRGLDAAAAEASVGPGDRAVAAWRAVADDGLNHVQLRWRR